jgi:ATP-dependent Clp protease ATP-binding subunit ClpB
MSYLTEKGYDPVYGARPLKRAIQRELQDPLAMRLLAGEFRPGDRIAVERGPDGLDFAVVTETEVTPEIL